MERARLRLALVSSLALLGCGSALPVVSPATTTASGTAPLREGSTNVRDTGARPTPAVIADAIVASRQDVQEGIPLSVALGRKQVFPELALSMLAIGEETGQMDTMLSKVADFYEDEVEAAVKALTSMLEPAMIVIVGGIVGSILLAMYLPMFSIFDQIK